MLSRAWHTTLMEILWSLPAGIARFGYLIPGLEAILFGLLKDMAVSRVLGWFGWAIRVLLLPLGSVK